MAFTRGRRLKTPKPPSRTQMHKSAFGGGEFAFWMLPESLYGVERVQPVHVALVSETNKT